MNATRFSLRAPLRRIALRASIPALLIVACGLLSGCGGGPSSTVPPAPTVATITVTAASSSIAVNATDQFTAMAKDSGGNTIAGVAFTWASSATNVATINSNGLATGVLAGTTQITAASGGVTSSVVTLTVTPGLVATITVTPAAPSIVVNATEQFTATAKDSAGDILSGVSFTWSSSETNVATISNASGSQGLATPTGVGTTTIDATVGAITGSTSLTVTAGFVYTGSLSFAPVYPTATLLNNGMVLIAGGYDGSVLANAELYNPAAGTFTPTGSLNTARYQHTAALLNNGMVLIAGGIGASGTLTSAELYNPTNGTFTPTTGPLNTARALAPATVLNDGTVLVVGGKGSFGSGLSSAELYNPATGTFTYTLSMNTQHYEATATLLASGMVLVVGGYGPGGSILASAELYNPGTGAFTLTGSMNEARHQPSATLLNNGLVLIAGGGSSTTNVTLASAELYDPASGTFTLTTGSLSTARFFHTATLLTNGTVLIAGGYGSGSDTPALASAELYDPAAETFTLTGNLNTGREGQPATLLTNGTVLTAGGQGSSFSVYVNSAELYESATLPPPNLVLIAITPATPTLASGTTQKFIAKGTFSDNSTQQLASVIWSSSNTSVAQISNDATNPGVSLAIAAGTTNITATAGNINGSTTLTVH